MVEVDIVLFLELGENAAEAFERRACPTDQFKKYDAQIAHYVRYLT
jgi:hypothetical protein